MRVLSDVKHKKVDEIGNESTRKQYHLQFVRRTSEQQKNQLKAPFAGNCRYFLTNQDLATRIKLTWDGPADKHLHCRLGQKQPEKRIKSSKKPEQLNSCLGKSINDGSSVNNLLVSQKDGFCAVSVRFVGVCSEEQSIELKQRQQPTAGVLTVTAVIHNW